MIARAPIIALTYVHRTNILTAICRGLFRRLAGSWCRKQSHFAPVTAARASYYADDHYVRANMTASWLAQMGWEGGLCYG